MLELTYTIGDVIWHNNADYRLITFGSGKSLLLLQVFRAPIGQTRFQEPVRFDSGVRWEPSGYKPMDQTSYLAYQDKEDDKVRNYQNEHAK